MVSLQRIKNREGVAYARVYEGWRENGKAKTRVIKNYGRVDQLEAKGLGTFEELKAKVDSGQIPFESHKTQYITKIDLTEKLSDDLLNFGHIPLDSIYNSLDLNNVIGVHQSNIKCKYNINEILKFIVNQRILNPGSKLNTKKQLRKMLTDNHFDYNHIDRSLDHLYLLKDDIQLQIHKSISKNIGRTATLVFYDVTNYYFETDIQDDFRKRGPSKEHRPNPIVQMGLFMDSNGIPISYELFEGNYVDPKTYIPAIERVKKQFGIERIVTVADKAMNSASNVKDAYCKGDGWLFSSKFRGRRGAPKDIQKFVLNETGWKYNQDKTFASKSMIRERKIDKNTIVKEKVLVTWRKSYALREKYKRQEVLKVAYKMTKSEMERQLMGKGVKKFLTSFDPQTGEEVRLSSLYGINNEQIEFDEQFDGMNVIVTSETQMKDEEMINAYGQLNRIEDCFRGTKTDLNTRPVFVWTKEHIEAHFLTCFIALVIIKVLYNRLDKAFSIRSIVKALNSAKCSKKGKYYVTFASKKFVDIMDKLGVCFDKKHNGIEDFQKLLTCKTF